MLWAVVIWCPANISGTGARSYDPSRCVLRFPSGTLEMNGDLWIHTVVRNCGGSFGWTCRGAARSGARG